MRFSPWLQRFHRLERNVGWRVRELFRLGKKRPARQSAFRKSGLAGAAEVFEDRTLLSTLTVNSLEDNTNEDDVLTLREAILLVNNRGDADAAFGGPLTPQEMNQIDNSNGGFGTNDTIIFSGSLAGGTILLNGTELPIMAAVVINGLGANQLTIDGDFASRIFEVDDFDDDNQFAVSISGLTLAGGSTFFDGGAIQNFEALTISNSILSDNTADGFSGAIDNFGMLTVMGSTISRNSAGGGGGAIDNFGTVSISNSTISQNSAGLDGGGLSNRNGGMLSVTNSTVSQNTADGLGGGIYNDSNLTVSGSGFSQNSAGIDGGGIENFGGTVSVTNSTFTGNTASVFGGAIDNFQGTLTVSGSTIVLNVTFDSGGGITNLNGSLTVTNSTISFNAAGCGGGIANLAGTLTVINTTISDNFSDRDGGGIENQGMLTVAGNSSITNNTAFQFGGGIDNFEGQVTIRDSTVSSNSALDGAGIENSGTLTVTNSIFTQNTAERFGGGIDNFLGTVSIQDSTVSFNSALDGAGIENFGDLIASNTTFTQNTAERFGGGIDNFQGTAIISNSTVTLNSAEFGGGIEVFESTVTVTNTIISQNFADFGGGIDNFDGTLTVQGGSITQNSASLGGGINNFIDDDFSPSVTSLTVQGVAVSQNVAFSLGGGINNFGGGILVADSSITGNFSGQDGGGIESEFGILNVINTVISQNGAFGIGGGIDNFFGSAVIRNSTIEQNFADFGGGGIYNNQDLLIADSSLSQNSARAGGGIFNDGILDDVGNVIGTLSIVNTSLSQNTATGNGGGFSTTITQGGGGILNNGRLNLQNSTLSQNVANGEGGGILNFRELNLGFSTLSQNTALGNGGGISSFGTTAVANSLLFHNSAGLDGGGISSFGMTRLDNSTLSQNSANGNGGGIMNGSALQLTNVTVFGNQADADGNGTGTGGGLWTLNAPNVFSRLFNTIVAGNLRGVPSAPNDIANQSVDPISRNNLIGDPNSAGGLTQGVNGNIVGDGKGNLLDVNTVLDTTLRDNGGPTLTHALVPGSPAINAGFEEKPPEFTGGVPTVTPPNPIKQPNTPEMTMKVRMPPMPMAMADTETPMEMEIQRQMETPMLITNVPENSEESLFDQRGPNFFRVTGGRIDIGAFEVQLHIDLAISTGGGIEGTVQIFSSEFAQAYPNFTPYTIKPTEKDPAGFIYMGGVRVALGDVTGDGFNEIITATGAGAAPHVKIFDGRTFQLIDSPLASFYAYAPQFIGGVFVAAADLDNDGFADLITGAGEGGGPHVKAFSGADGSELFSFFAFDPNFLGGVRVAGGDINGNGTGDIIAAAGPGGGPHVRVFEGSAPERAAMGQNIAGPLGSFWAYEPSYTGGVYVAADNTGFPQGTLIVTGSGPKIGGATVGFFGNNGVGYFQTPLFSGVTVATFDFNRDGINDFVTSTGPLGNAQVQVLAGTAHQPPFTTTNLPFGPPLLNAYAFVPGAAGLTPLSEVPPATALFRGGVFVAAAIANPLTEDFTALDSAFATLPFSDLE